MLSQIAKNTATKTMKTLHDERDKQIVHLFQSLLLEDVIADMLTEMTNEAIYEGKCAKRTAGKIKNKYMRLKILIIYI